MTYRALSRPTTPMTAPNMTDPLPDDDGTHPHKEQRQLPSLQATFNLQTQMLRTLKMLVVELTEKVELLLAAITYHQTSSIPRPLSTLLPSTMQSTTNPPFHCLTSTLRKTLIPPWPLRHANLHSNLAPFQKLACTKNLSQPHLPSPALLLSPGADSNQGSYASALGWLFPCASTINQHQCGSICLI